MSEVLKMPRLYPDIRASMLLVVIQPGAVKIGMSEDRNERAGRNEQHASLYVRDIEVFLRTA